MRRRAFITLLGGAATWPLDAIAQQSAEVRRVGVLANEPWPPLEGLRDGMRGLGYIENQSLHFEYRFAEGRAERFPAFAAELVCLPIRLWPCSGRERDADESHIALRGSCRRVAFGGCNMRVLWQSNHIESRARPVSVTLNREAVMAIRKKATRRNKAKRKKTLVTKTATPTKTKTLRNKRAMNGSPLLAPQLITGARMLYLVWIPEDPLAVAALVPKELRPEARRSVFMNQYVVDNAEQTSSAGLPGAFGAYSLTYLGADLEGLDAQPGTPGRWWAHYFNSSTNMIDYAKKRGVPAGAGETALDFSGDQLIATTMLGGAPVIRTTCTVQVGAGQRASGQLRYITRVGGQLVSGRYPFVMKTADQFHVDKLEFLDRSHPTYDLRPKSPLEVTFGFYSPDITFCYPGGEGPLNAPPHGI